MAFGRSNSLSLNTGAANSALYASPSPSFTRPTMYPGTHSRVSTTACSIDRPKVNPEASDGDYLVPTATMRTLPTHNVTVQDAPWLDPNWKPPTGPVMPTRIPETPASNLGAPPLDPASKQSPAPMLPSTFPPTPDPTPPKQSDYSTTPATGRQMTFAVSSGSSFMPAMGPTKQNLAQLPQKQSDYFTTPAKGREMTFAVSSGSLFMPAMTTTRNYVQLPPKHRESPPVSEEELESPDPTPSKAKPSEWRIESQWSPKTVGKEVAPWLDPNWEIPGEKPPTPTNVEPSKKSLARTNERATPGSETINRPDLMGKAPEERKKMTLTYKSGQQQGGSLFGGGASTSQPQQGGSLFGASTQTSQPQAANNTFGGSLFGGAQQATPQQNTQQPASGGLFGNTQQSQPQQEQKPASGGLFGGGQTNQQSTQQQPASGGMFGNMTANAAKPVGSGSLFGGSTTQQPSGGLFGNNSTTQQPLSNSLFGGNQTQNQGQQQQQQPGQTSLLGASRYNQSQYQPFVTGRLTMGQGQGGAPQPTATPATKLDWSNVRSTTRFNDLTDEAKQDIEKIDKMITEQENLCKQIEAFLPNHQKNLETLGPDVQLITDKLEEVDRSLAFDAQGVQQNKNITEKDDIDINRCIRIVDNLRMPAQYIYHPAANSGRQPQPPAWDETYDVDLVGNYFQPLTSDMARLLATYSGNLAEIENHMSTIEQSTVARAQQFAAYRSGMGGPRNVTRETVEQLRETLSGMGDSILTVAGQVGGCRESVNELLLGKLGGQQPARRPW